MTAPDYIDNHSAVIAFYGYWPAFHDAQVPAYQYDQAGDPLLSFTLHTWRMTNQVDERGYFILQDHSLVSFRFEGIHDADMDSFRSGNILYGLTFSRGDDPTSFRVELDSVMDMSGAFSARSGRVVSIVPCHANGTPA
jgi:hypothetical protein